MLLYIYANKHMIFQNVLFSRINDPMVLPYEVLKSSGKIDSVCQGAMRKLLKRDLGFIKQDLAARHLPQSSILTKSSTDH